MRFLVILLLLIYMAEQAGGWQNFFLIMTIALIAVFYIQFKGVGSPRPSISPPNHPTSRKASREELKMEPVSTRTFKNSSEMTSPGEFVQLVDPTLHNRSGSVFYSGRGAFRQPSNIYILGLNPGGSPVGQAKETISADLIEWNKLPERWSAYADESWMGRPPGKCGLQPRVLHLFNKLGLDPRDVPASNVVFVRSTTEASLSVEKRSLLAACWPVHERVIASLGVRTIVCLGTTAGAWVREAVSANVLFDEFRETNNRGWRSQAHRNLKGLQVLTLTHPSRADWTNVEADPSPMVRRAISSRG